MANAYAALFLQRRGIAGSPFVPVAAGFAIVLIAAATFGGIARDPKAALTKSDFAAFYCGAVVAAEGRDPYALGPLAACQDAHVYLPGSPERARAAVDPDPLPGYHMAFFRPFTLLGYRHGALAFDAVLLAAIVATALLLAQITGIPAIVIGAVLAYLDGFTSIPYDQTSPLVAFGLSLAAFGLVRERRPPVYAGLALAMLAPHVGLALCGALFVWRPRLRWGIAGVLAVLGAVSLATLGVRLNIEYLLLALPTQALAESGTTIQYGSAALLEYFGVADATAVRIASLQYAVFAVACIALAGRVERRVCSAAAIALFPATVVLIGGSYIHLQQMAAALPFALLLAGHPRYRVAWIAVLLLALPWPADQHVLLMGALATVAAVVPLAIPARKRGVILGLTGAALLGYAIIAGPLLNRAVPSHPQHALSSAPSMARTVGGEILASEQDARQVRAEPELAIWTPRTFAAKVPTWLALMMLVALALRSRSASNGGRSAPSGWEVRDRDFAAGVEARESALG